MVTAACLDVSASRVVQFFHFRSETDSNLNNVLLLPARKFEVWRRHYFKNLDSSLSVHLYIRINFFCMPI